MVTKKNRGKSSELVAVMYDALQSWLLTGPSCRINFQLEDAASWEKEHVTQQWSTKSSTDILLDTISSEERVTMKRRPAPRDVYIAKMGHKLLTYMK